jgi:hypothetical protein
LFTSTDDLSIVLTPVRIRRTIPLSQLFFVITELKDIDTFKIKGASEKHKN